MTAQDDETEATASRSAISDNVSAESTLRRSGRSRRAAESYYEDAARDLERKEERRSSLEPSTSRPSIGSSSNRIDESGNESYEEKDEKMNDTE